jgi:hypothetical protein
MLVIQRWEMELALVDGGGGRWVEGWIRVVSLEISQRS